METRKASSRETGKESRSRATVQARGSRSGSGSRYHTAGESGQKRQGNSFLAQGSILAMASIFSRVIGLLYRLPLTGIIGKQGNDYYGTAFEIYSIILIISAYSIPLAVSKLVAARVSVGEIKSADRVLKGSLVFAASTGGTAALVVFFGADFFSGLLKTPFASPALRVLAPVIFVVAVVGVLRGFFQGLGSMMPSAISQIVEQIINAIVSVVAAYFLFDLGLSIGKKKGDPDSWAAAYGAAGGTLGTALGAVFALLFMIFIFWVYQRIWKRKLRRDRRSEAVGYGEVMKTLVLTIVPVLLSTTLYNVSAIIDTGLFKNTAHLQGYDVKQISDWWGVFTGQYRVIINVPVSIASAIAASSVPSLTAAHKSGDQGLVREQIDSATRFVMVIAFPCAMGLAVLAAPIMRLLFGDTDPTSGLMLIAGAVSVVFYSLSTLSNGLLQGIDKLELPVRHAAVALVLQAGLLYVLMELFHLNIYAVIYANAFYALLMCVLNEIGLRRHSGAQWNVKKTILLPLLSSVVMGLGCFCVYHALYGLLGSNALATIMAILAAIPVYFITLIYAGGLSRQELSGFPKVGRLLVKAGDLLHIIRE